MDEALAAKLVKIGETARNLKGHGLDEGISTRLLVYAATLMNDGMARATPAAWPWSARSPMTPISATRWITQSTPRLRDMKKRRVHFVHRPSLTGVREAHPT